MAQLDARTIFITPLDSFNSDADEAESITDNKKPRKVKYQIHWRPEQDAVCWIHLSTAQDAGLEFWQTGSNAMITYQSVPKECVVKVVSESVKRELFARTAHTSRTTKSNTQTIMGSYEIQYCEHASGKPRVICRPGNSDPNASGSRIWPKVEVEQSFDLRIDGIPNDETYTDERPTCSVRCTVQYVRAVGQGVSPGKCVLLSTSKTVRKIMKLWDVSGDGEPWTVELGRQGSWWSSGLH